MKGSFSDEALLQYSELVAQKAPADFAEGDTYDFTRCVRADGTFYASSGKCRKGSEAGPREKPAAGGGKKKAESEAPIAPVPPKPIKDPIPGILAKAKELKDFHRKEDQRVTDLAKAGKIKGVDPGAVDRILAKKEAVAPQTKLMEQIGKETDVVKRANLLKQLEDLNNPLVKTADGRVARAFNPASPYEIISPKK
jgi:hypothetical protein